MKNLLRNKQPLLFTSLNLLNYKKLFSYAIFVVLTAVFVSCSSTIEKEKTEPLAVMHINQYGFTDDSLKIDTTFIKKNTAFADVLLPFNIPYKTILEMAKIHSSNFDARKIDVGDRFLIYTKKDSSRELSCIVYEKDAVNYIVFDFGDTLRVINGSKNVTRKEAVVSGIITNSLFETLISQNVNTSLALKLADIYAWQIDFYRIRKGDYFKVIYNEIYVENKFNGIGKIKAAVFHHFKKDYYAFYFNQGDKLDYFDENGNSLRKAFLRAPLKFSRISSRYTGRRYHPVFHKYKAHRGIDFAAPTGTPVHAIGDGVVTAVKYKRGNGKYIKIKHNSTYQSGYLHLSRYAKGIKPGKTVKQGQTIGYVGSTGYATGPHLDLRFWKNGQLVNYLGIEFPPSKPISKKFAEKFEDVSKNYVLRLKQIGIRDSSVSTGTVLTLK